MRKTPFLCITLLCLMLVSSVSAQDKWSYYTSENGLPSKEVRAITEDANGNKWIGTDGGGFVKYDGTAWSAYTENDGLIYNKVRKIAVDATGNLWLATPRGLSSFDGTKFQNYTVDNGLPADHVTTVAIDKMNRKWIGTYGKGIAIYNDDSWQYLTSEEGLVDDFIVSASFDKDDNVWIGTHNGVSVYNGMKWTNYTTENSGLPSNFVPSLYIDENNVKWFGTANGIASFNGTEWTTYSAQSEYDILHDRTILSITKDENGILWCGTSTGLWSFDGEKWQSYTKYDSDLKESCGFWSIYVDHQGAKWLGTDNMVTVNEADAEPVLKKSSLPIQMKITGNYPNPFNPTTTIAYYLPEASRVRISVYNITGQKIKTLLTQDLAAGSHSVIWDGKNDAGTEVATGMYILRLETANTAVSHKMSLIR